MDKVLINKIINEEHPKAVYFVPYWSKWLLMITTQFLQYLTFNRVGNIIA